MSEINPLAIHFFAEFSPLYQDRQWLHLLSDEEVARFSNLDLGQNQHFCEVIRALHSRAEIAGHHLILRDYNYVDFVGVPFVARPPRRRVLYDALPPEIPTRAIAFVRDPIDQWRSLLKHAHVGETLTPSHFCDAYRAFLQDLGDTPVFKYEDFVRDPQGELSRICEHLQLSFQSSFLSDFQAFSSLTGDFTRQAESKISLPRATPLAREVIDEFRSVPSFFAVTEALEYESDRAASIAPRVWPWWAASMAGVGESIDSSRTNIPRGINTTLDEARLVGFLAEFGEDSDVQDLLTLDVICTAAGLLLDSGGLRASMPGLALAPSRLWESTWLFKTLQLSKGGKRVLNLGAPAAHVAILAAVAGCHVTSVDSNPMAVDDARECARALNLASWQIKEGDFRNLSAFPNSHFDIVIVNGAFNYLRAEDFKVALMEGQRVVSADGVVALTFHLGAESREEDNPSTTWDEAILRSAQCGLIPIGGPAPQAAQVGTVATLFLAKEPVPHLPIPECRRDTSKLSHLLIRELPYRLYKSARAETALTASLRRQLDEARTRASIMETAAAERLLLVERLDKAARELQVAAQERLMALNEKEAVNAKLRERVAQLESELRKATEENRADASARR